MMRLRHVQLTLVLILAVALLALAGLLLRQSRRLATYQRQQADDQQSLRELRAALGQQGLAKMPAESEGRIPDAEYRAALASRDQKIKEVRAELSDAQASLASLQAQVLSSSKEHAAALAAVQENLQKQQAAWQDQLGVLKQQLSATQEELQASRLRITALEQTNTKLRDESSEGSAQASQVRSLVSDLLELERRRNTYLTSIIRRYGDVTNQFRAMTGMLDSSRDSNSNACGGAALSRIQDVLSSAGDDLDQLNQLNAQALRLQKKLAKK
jgi:chromosome segregation ATPase